jgi:hypothetical protein
MIIGVPAQIDRSSQTAFPVKFIEYCSKLKRSHQARSYGCDGAPPFTTPSKPDTHSTPEVCQISVPSFVIVIDIFQLPRWCGCTFRSGQVLFAVISQQIRTFVSRPVFAIITMFWHIQFLCLRDMMEESSLEFCYPSPPPSPEIPMPTDHENDVEDVKCDHDSTFPNLQFSIHQENHTKTGCHHEETNVTHKALPCNLEGVDQGHACGNNGRYKAGSTKQFSDSKTATVGVHGCKGRKDVRAAVSKG